MNNDNNYENPIRDPNIRQSNIELGRIIAMSMVLIVHFCLHGGLYKTCCKGIMGLTIYGVDIFVMISGIFLIKLRWQSVLRLIFIVLGFEILTIVLSYLFIGTAIHADLFKFIKIFIAPLSGSQYWFIQVYFILMILSPLLNAAIKSIDWRHFRKIMLILTFVNIYSCNLINNFVDHNGYDIFNFIYLYLLGYFITHDNLIGLIKDKWVLITAIVCVILSVFMVYFPVPIYKSFSYSSVTTIIVSASIVLLLYRHPFKNRIVNQLGSCALGAYLLQDGILGYNFIYAYQKSLIENGEIAKYILIAVLLFLGYWLIAWIFFKFLNILIPKLIDKISVKLEYITNLCVNRLGSKF